MTIGEALRGATARLQAAGIEGARLEARLLLAHVLATTTDRLLLDRGARIDDPAPFERALTRRLAHEPLALITGQREFWSLDFAVSHATLIPRADSETLIEAALAAFPDRGRVRRVLDLGTGTGCLLLAALTEFPVAFGVGVDRIDAAASLARRNAAALGLDGRAGFVVADWTEALTGRFDLVLSNPPYIAEDAIATLMPEVALHEPASALAGGADGLDAYRRIVPALPGLLAPGGAAILEVGAGQAADVSALGAAAGLAGAIRPDLAGIARAVILCAPATAGAHQITDTKKPFGSTGFEG